MQGSQNCVALYMPKDFLNINAAIGLQPYKLSVLWRLGLADHENVAINSNSFLLKQNELVFLSTSFCNKSQVK